MAGVKVGVRRTTRTPLRGGVRFVRAHTLADLCALCALCAIGVRERLREAIERKGWRP